jgi:hypothetical protein
MLTFTVLHFKHKLIIWPEGSARTAKRDSMRKQGQHSIKTILQTTDSSCQQISEMESPSVRSKYPEKNHDVAVNLQIQDKFAANSWQIRGLPVAGPAARPQPAASAPPSRPPCPPCASAVCTGIHNNHRCPPSMPLSSLHDHCRRRTPLDKSWCA